MPPPDPDAVTPRHETVLNNCLAVASEATHAWTRLTPVQRRGLMAAWAGFLEDLQTLKIVDEQTRRGGECGPDLR